MILPLQTWQHQDPKGLWPALGGLAVLAHIGAIGMSVPYLLSLREAEVQNAATAIPIELSVEPSANSALVETPAVESDKPVVSDSQAVTESAIAPNQKAGFSARSPISKSLATESPSPPESIFDQSDNAADPQTSAENEESETTGDSGISEAPETSETSDVATGTSDVATEGPSQSLDNSLGDPLQTLKGDDDLLAPTVNTAAGQSLQIRVVDAPQSVPVEDFQSPLPELVDPGYVGMLRPEAEGCGRVSALATQSSLVYRISVGLDGTIDDANLYGNNSIEPDSDDDKAVACLIKKTGITFKRTVSGNNDKPLDDRLLLTFELSEQ